MTLIHKLRTMLVCSFLLFAALSAPAQEFRGTLTGRITAPQQAPVPGVKITAITEKINLQYRCDIFNSLNHPIFAAPNVSPTAATFGTVTSQANLPRGIQMALRLAW